FPKWKGRHNIEHGGESGKVIVLFGDINLPIQNPRCHPLRAKKSSPSSPTKREEPKKGPQGPLFDPPQSAWCRLINAA
ncbi:hypothetical protein, partial [Janthinobacterium sp. MDT1-19]|uniref:hypothetical protein n=1 Tax=Janthinobacterium sp. MDT1-19 TaxID=1259339 RepID=UPI003F207F15